MLDRLLQHHVAIFEEPQGLPPARPYDHCIHLLPGTAPVAVRLYRYPQLQKDELERQVAGMLTQGIIRPSTSLLTVYFGTPSMFITLWFEFDYGTNPPLGTLII
jgi:hypothetical protein